MPWSAMVQRRCWLVRSNVIPIVGNKPMAIGECAMLPTPELLAQQPRWAFFMAWSELVQEKNAPEAIKRLYDDPCVLTLDEMPQWIKRK